MAEQVQKDSFVAALAGLGGSAGNKKLREALGWDEGTYEKVKQALIDDRGIVTGRSGTWRLGEAFRRFGG